ncbi:MAG: enoyl-CoA hydratase/isomerase family protein [Deltaproteobacteria bacterium]|jgi:hypothetical protein|nr:enoyl-CoA hydratase/isomerase family protein [Deltaproteobacteria bacterium]MDX9762655.1 enoyl-CoA hydratase/isomerase family protein [Desulfomonilia bacterium]
MHPAVCTATGCNTFPGCSRALIYDCLHKNNHLSPIVGDILNELKDCVIQDDLCEGVFERLSERSPMAVTITLQCLRRDEGRDLREVYQSDLKVAGYLMEQHDFKEGVRARLIDRDNCPQWNPDTFENAAVMLPVLPFEE